MHKIAVVGGLGNMGRRYCSILKMLHIDHYVLDIATVDPKKFDLDTTGIIIATPTEYHGDHIRKYAVYNVPILCEKPICKNRLELDNLLLLDVNLRMINQYEHFLGGEKDCKRVQEPPVDKRSYYNYFKSGSDGLYWDVINIVGLTDSGKIKVGNESPIWECWLNGTPLNIRDMDHAYVWNIRDWLAKYDDNKAYIRKAHDRIFDMLGDK